MAMTATFRTTGVLRPGEAIEPHSPMHEPGTCLRCNITRALTEDQRRREIPPEPVATATHWDPPDPWAPRQPDPRPAPKPGDPPDPWAKREGR